MPNILFDDSKSKYRDPAAILAVLAAKHAAEMMDHSILERGPGGALLTDPKLDEGILVGLALRALCQSRGIPESDSDQIAWSFYCRGVLQSVVFDYEVEKLSVPYAWPSQRLALVLTTTLDDFEQHSAEEIADLTYFEAAREAVFAQNDWVVLRVDPDSPTLEDQLGRIAALVLSLKVGAEERGVAS